MPANKSLNKVRVTRLHGQSSTIALMDPAVNMQVTQGLQPRWITSLDSGNGQVGLALTSGGATIAKEYPHNLVVDQVVASGFGFPGAAEVVQFGRAALFAGGVPAGVGSGHFFMSGNGTVSSFGR